MPELFHVSRERNRASILAHGLYATTWDAERQAPRRIPVFAIPGQPDALYLTASVEDAWVYACHYWSRFRPAEPAYGQLDLWRVELNLDVALKTDADWQWTTAFWTQQDVPPGRVTLVESWAYQHGYAGSATAGPQVGHAGAATTVGLDT